MPTTKQQKPSPEMNDRMKEVLRESGNKKCADCPAKRPLWVSFLFSPVDKEQRMMAVFVCSSCAQHHHFKLGEKRCMIKYLKMAHEWTMEDIEILERSGNDFVNKMYERNLSRRDFDKKFIDRDEEEEEHRRAKFIKYKYKQRKWADEIELHENMLELVLKKKGRKSFRETSERTKQDRGTTDQKTEARFSVTEEESIEFTADQSVSQDGGARERRQRFLNASYTEGASRTAQAPTKNGFLNSSYTEGVATAQRPALSPTKEYEKSLPQLESSFVVLRQPQPAEKPNSSKETTLSAVLVGNNSNRLTNTKADDSTLSSADSASRVRARPGRVRSNKNLKLALNNNNGLGGSDSSVGKNFNYSAGASVASSSQGGSSVDDPRRMRRRLSNRNLMAMMEQSSSRLAVASEITTAFKQPSLVRAGSFKNLPTLTGESSMIGGGSIKNLPPLTGEPLVVSAPGAGRSKARRRSSFSFGQPTMGIIAPQRSPMARRQSLTSSNAAAKPDSVVRAAVTPQRSMASLRSLSNPKLNLKAPVVAKQPILQVPPANPLPQRSMARRRSLSSPNVVAPLATSVAGSPPTAKKAEPLKRPGSSKNLMAMGLQQSQPRTEPLKRPGSSKNLMAMGLQQSPRRTPRARRGSLIGSAAPPSSASLVPSPQATKSRRRSSIGVLGGPGLQALFPGKKPLNVSTKQSIAAAIAFCDDAFAKAPGKVSSSTTSSGGSVKQSALRQSSSSSSSAGLRRSNHSAGEDSKQKRSSKADSSKKESSSDLPKRSSHKSRGSRSSHSSRNNLKRSTHSLGSVKRQASRIPTAVELGYEDPDVTTTTPQDSAKLQKRKEKILEQADATAKEQTYSDSLKSMVSRGMNESSANLKKTSSCGSAKAA